MRFAVVPTHDRPDDFRDCVAAISPQVDYLIVIAHRCAYPAEVVAPYVGFVDEPGACGVAVLEYQPEVPNISRMWNLGIDYAKRLMGPRPHWVAVLNDDVVAPPDWYDRVTAAMRDEFPGGAAAGCVKRPTDPRMTGYAFILDGTRGLRADEQFQWWWGDTDLERQAMAAGGVAYAGGEDVTHRHPNSTTIGVLAQVAAEDGVRYRAKWGFR